MAHAVDSEHPELKDHAASSAAEYFLRHEGLKSADVPETFQMLANTQSLKISIDELSISTQKCEKLQQVVNATPLLHTLVIGFTSETQSKILQSFVLDLRHLKKLRSLELSSPIDMGIYGTPLQVALADGHPLEELVLLAAHSSDPRVVYNLLEKLPALQRLTLDNGAEFLRVPFALPVEILARAKNLQQLRLEAHWACDHRGIAALVPRLPHLDTLKVRSSLEFNSRKLPLMTPLFLTPLPQITDLTLSGFALPHTHTALDFSNVPNIKSLDLSDMEFWQGMWRDLPKLRLQACTKLEQLSIAYTNLTVRDLGLSGVGPAISQGKLKVDLLGEKDPEE